MTDKDELVVLLQRWEVPFVERTLEGNPEVLVGRFRPDEFTDRIADHEGYGDRLAGYFGFYTRFEFGPDGSFLKMGAWE